MSASVLATLAVLATLTLFAIVFVRVSLRRHDERARANTVALLASLERPTVAAPRENVRSPNEGTPQ